MKNKNPNHSKLKIVWICHFMNQFIKEKLSIPIDLKESAPWITLGIHEFKKRDDVELHIISPLNSILRNGKFSEGNVHYYFVKVGIPILRRGWPDWFDLDLWSNYFPFNWQVRKLIDKIKPDLVNLIGAENAYYSSSILAIKNYPVLVTIQGFVALNNLLDESYSKPLLKRISVEEKILKEVSNFGIETSSMEKFINTYNPLAKMYWFHFPFAKTHIDSIPEKEYDLVFFAKVTKMKGIEDAFKALSKVKCFKPDVSMEIIGSTDHNYLISLKQLAKDLDITENIEFKGFIPTQRDMHIEVMKARISILPTYNDTIPGTIVESMLLGLPVVSYKTGGVPDINKDGEYIILVEQGDVEGLSKEIIKLLNNNDELISLGEKAKIYASTKFDNTNSANLLVNAYKEIINDYNK